MGTLLEIGLSNAVLAAILAVPAAAMGLICRRPALTHALWLLVFLKLVTPPLFPVQVPWFQEAADDGEPSVARGEREEVSPVRGVHRGTTQDAPTDAEAAAASAPETRTVPPGPAPVAAQVPAPEPPVEASSSPGAPSAWLWIVASLWPAGAVLFLGWITGQVGRFQRLLRHGRLASPSVQLLAREIAAQLGLKKCPAVWLVPGAVSPMLWGLGLAPRLLFPAGLLERLERVQLKTLLVHELAHFRRRDHWTRLLEVVVLCLYWWHPLVWWARRELHEAEEQCCDAWVVWHQAGQGRAYALALVQAVAFFSHAPSPLPVAASGIGQVTHLRRRLTMIMQGKTPRSLSWLGASGVLGLALLLPVVPLGAQVAAPESRGPDNSRQEKIKILKQAIKILEDEEARRPAAGTSDDPKKTQEIVNAKVAVHWAAAEVKAKQLELQHAQARLKQAAEDFARLSGQPIDPSQQSNNGPRRKADPTRAADPNSRPAGGRIGLASTPSLDFKPASEKNGTDLERKLDRLLTEVDELRRELRKGKPRPRSSRAAPMPERNSNGAGSAIEPSPNAAKRTPPVSAGR